MKIKGGTYSLEACLKSLREVVWEERDNWTVGIKFLDVLKNLEEREEVLAAIQKAMPYLKLLASLFPGTGPQNKTNEKKPELEKPHFCVFEVLPRLVSDREPTKPSVLKGALQRIVSTKTVMVLMKTIPQLVAESGSGGENELSKDEIMWMLVGKMLRKEESLVFLFDFIECLSEANLFRLAEILGKKDTGSRSKDDANIECCLEQEEIKMVGKKMGEVTQKKEKEGIWDGFNFALLSEKISKIV
jgi:hypothetical protein